VRRLSPLLCLALGTTAGAQMNLAPTLAKAIRVAQQSAKPANTAPLPEPKDNPKDFELLNWDKSVMIKDHVRAEGDVHFKSRGYEVWCDALDGDKALEVYDLEGNVRVEGKGQSVKGEKVRIRLKEKSIEYIKGSARIAAGTFGPKLNTDLFMHGGALGGTQEHYSGTDLNVTTCNLPHPHFDLRARDVDIRPKKWMTLRDTTLTILDRKIMRIPYIIIPLLERGDRYLPTIGRSSDEGYYILSKWPVPLRGNAYVDQRIDAFSKLGLGLGEDLHYNSRSAQGLARVYQIIGRSKSQLLSLDHAQQIGPGNLRISSVYQHNNYLTAPNTSTFNVNSSYNVSSKRGNTRLGYTEYSSRTTTYDSLTSNLALSDARTHNSHFKTNLDFNLSDNSSSSTFATSNVRRRQFDVKLRADLTAEKVDSEFSYIRSIPIGTQKNFFNSMDRTPMVTFRTDANRWWKDGTAKVFPWRLETSVGQLADYQKPLVTRTDLDFSMGNSATAANGSSFNYDSRLRQGIYSDGTAQYVLSENFGYKYSFLKKSYFQFRYSLIDPHGYTPLSLDRSGRTNSSYMDFMYESGHGLRFGTQTSYDFLAHEQKREPWQTVGIRLDYEPSKELYIRNNMSFDTYRARWGDIRTDMGFKTGGGFIVIGSRYDSLRNKFGSLNLYAQGLKWGRLTSSLLLNYNGYTKQFDSQQAELTWDMHCSEAYFQIINNPTGFRNGVQLSFGVRIKGLPMDTGFGAGRRGNAIGTGTGGGF